MAKRWSREDLDTLDWMVCQSSDPMSNIEACAFRLGRTKEAVYRKYLWIRKHQSSEIQNEVKKDLRKESFLKRIFHKLFKK